MTQFKEYIGRELKWEQPHATRMEYELLAGGEQISTLRFRSSFGTLATAQCAEGCWTFKRVGFFQTRVTVRPCNSEVEIAGFRNKTWSGGGTLEFADGRTLLASTTFWQTRYEFKTESGDPVVTFTPGGFLHFSSGVEIGQTGLAYPELPMLVNLGLYLAVMLRNDSAAAVAATST